MRVRGVAMTMRCTGAVLATLFLGMGCTLAGCTDGRSPAAFCRVMEQHRERYEAAAGDAMTLVVQGDLDGILAGGAQMVMALGDLQVMWDDLADVAPEEIRTDVERVRDHNQEQLDAAAEALNDPLKALVGSLTSGLASSGSYDRLNDYAGEHCGSRPF